MGRSLAKCFLLVLLGLLSVSLAQAEDELKVGVILPLTGEFSPPGVACRAGLELARAELQKQGLPIRLYVEDSPGASPKESLSAYQKLQAVDGVRVFIGFASPEELLAVAPAANRDGSALMAIGAPRQKPEGVLIIWMSPRAEATELARLVRRKFRRVAILSANQDWEGQVADFFTQEFSRLGGEVVFRSDHPFNDKNVVAEVARMRLSRPEALIIPPYSLFAAYSRELRKQRISAAVYALEIDQAALDDAGGGIDGTVMIRPRSVDYEFEQKFKAQMHKSPDLPAAQCYDGLGIAAKIYRSGARSGPDFRKAFDVIKEYRGASGRIEFSADGTVLETELLRVAGGTFSPLSAE